MKSNLSYNSDLFHIVNQLQSRILEVKFQGSLTFIFVKVACDS